MEQTVAKQSKPLLMMKALLAAYLATGIMLLLLALLLYKTGLGEPGESGHPDYLHSVLFSGRLLSWKKGRKPEISLGNGPGDWICSAADSRHFSDGTSDFR